MTHFSNSGDFLPSVFERLFSLFELILYLANG